MFKINLSREENLLEYGFGRSNVEFEKNNTAAENYMAVKMHPGFFGYHNYDGPLHMYVAKTMGRCSKLVKLKWPFPDGKVLKQIAGIIYEMPDVKNEDGSDNLNFLINEAPIKVQPEEAGEEATPPLEHFLENDYDTCHICEELYAYCDIDSHQCFKDVNKDEGQALTCLDCGLEYLIGPQETGHDCSKQESITETEQLELKDRGVALMTSFSERTMKATNEEAYRDPEMFGNVLPPFKRGYWLDGFVGIVGDPSVLFRIKYPGVFSIVEEPAIDSGGVTKEVVSSALESTCFELKTLMQYYNGSPDQETIVRLKAAGLVCSMAVVQCGFFEPTILEWARKLKGQNTHPFIIGMNLLDFADFFWENEGISTLFKSRQITATEFFSLLSREKNPRIEQEILEQCVMEHFSSFLSSVEKGRIMMYNGENVMIKATVNDVYKYCTGSHIIPLDTLKSELEGSARYKIEVGFFPGRNAGVADIPFAATCIPKITLPLTSKEKFKNAWQVALNYRTGFGTC